MSRVRMNIQDNKYIVLSQTDAIENYVIHAILIKIDDAREIIAQIEALCNVAKANLEKCELAKANQASVDDKRRYLDQTISEYLSGATTPPKQP